MFSGWGFSKTHTTKPREILVTLDEIPGFGEGKQVDVGVKPIKTETYPIRAIFECADYKKVKFPAADFIQLFRILSQWKDAGPFDMEKTLTQVFTKDVRDRSIILETLDVAGVSTVTKIFDFPFEQFMGPEPEYDLPRQMWQNLSNYQMGYEEITEDQYNKLKEKEKLEGELKQLEKDILFLPNVIGDYGSGEGIRLKEYTEMKARIDKKKHQIAMTDIKKKIEEANRLDAQNVYPKARQGGDLLCQGYRLIATDGRYGVLLRGMDTGSLCYGVRSREIGNVAPAILVQLDAIRRLHSENGAVIKSFDVDTDGYCMVFEDIKPVALFEKALKEEKKTEEEARAKLEKKKEELVYRFKEWKNREISRDERLKNLYLRDMGVKKEPESILVQRVKKYSLKAAEEQVLVDKLNASINKRTRKIRRIQNDLDSITPFNQESLYKYALITRELHSKDLILTRIPFFAECAEQTPTRLQALAAAIRQKLWLSDPPEYKHFKVFNLMSAAYVSSSVPQEDLYSLSEEELHRILSERKGFDSDTPLEDQEGAPPLAPNPKAGHIDFALYDVSSGADGYVDARIHRALMRKEQMIKVTKYDDIYSMAWLWITNLANIRLPEFSSDDLYLNMRILLDMGLGKDLTFTNDEEEELRKRKGESAKRLTAVSYPTISSNPSFILSKLTRANVKKEITDLLVRIVFNNEITELDSFIELSKNGIYSTASFIVDTYKTLPVEPEIIPTGKPDDRRRDFVRRVLELQKEDKYATSKVTGRDVTDDVVPDGFMNLVQFQTTILAIDIYDRFFSPGTKGILSAWKLRFSVDSNPRGDEELFFEEDLVYDKFTFARFFTIASALYGYTSSRLGIDTVGGVVSNTTKVVIDSINFSGLMSNKTYRRVFTINPKFWLDVSILGNREDVKKKRKELLTHGLKCISMTPMRDIDEAEKCQDAQVASFFGKLFVNSEYIFSDKTPPGEYYSQNSYSQNSLSSYDPLQDHF